MKVNHKLKLRKIDCILDIIKRMEHLRYETPCAN